jgi:hypothetical protein
MPRVKARLYPLGETVSGATLEIDERGRVWTSMGDLEFFAGSMKEAIEGLVLGKRPPRPADVEAG